MGNQEAFANKQTQKQWLQVNINGKSYVKNIITSQNFQYKILQQNLLHEQLSQIIQRSIYNLPKTPKIIIINDKKEQIQLLIQVCSQRIQDKIPKIVFFLDLLQIIKNFAITAQILCKKYGAFRITQQMMSFTESSDVLMWIHEQTCKSYVQQGFQSNLMELQMVQNILYIINKYSIFNIQCLQSSSYSNFSAFLSQINRIIIQTKEGKIKGQQKYVSREKNIYLSTPDKLLECPPFLKKNISTPQSKETQKFTFKRNVTQFIKKDSKEANSKLQLKNIPHKRTVTIEEIIDQHRLVKKIMPNQDKVRFSNGIKKVKSAQKMQEIFKPKHYGFHKIDNFTSSTQISKKKMSINSTQTFGKNYRNFKLKQDQKGYNGWFKDNEDKLSQVESTQFNNTPSTCYSIMPKVFRNQAGFPYTKSEEYDILEKEFNLIFEPLTERNDNSHIQIDHSWSNQPKSYQTSEQYQ